MPESLNEGVQTSSAINQWLEGLLRGNHQWRQHLAPVPLPEQQTYCAEKNKQETERFAATLLGSKIQLPNYNGKCNPEWIKIDFGKII